MPEPDRLAHQELLRALAGLVVVVDDAVVGGLEAIEPLGLAADRQRREQHVVVAAPAISPRPNTAPRTSRPAAPGAGSRRRRSRCARDRRSPGAESGCAARSRRCSDRAAPPRCRSRRPPRPRRPRCRLAQALHVDRDVFAGVGQGDHRFDRAVADHDDAHRRAAGPRVGRKQNAQLLSFAQAPVAAARAEHGGQRADILRPTRRDRAGSVAADSPFFTVTARSFQALPAHWPCRRSSAAA